MSHIWSYPSIYAIGHRAIDGLFDSDALVVQEKVDGSQISFGIIDGELAIRSKGADIYPAAPEGMFANAVRTIIDLDLTPGVVYRGEYLNKPKHNTLAYDRTPERHIVLFDIETAPSSFLTYAEMVAEAQRVGLEAVPLVHVGTVASADQLLGYLERDSFLGGQKVEGVVVKRYDLFTADKKVAMGKYVSEAFKERHGADWKARNPNRQDVVQGIIDSLRTEARWRKAVEHLRDRGELDGSPRDIGNLIKEVVADTEKEEADEIAALLFRHFWKQIGRAVTAGLPEWYKQQLAESAFAEAS